MKAAKKINEVVFPDCMSDLIKLAIDCVFECNGGGYRVLPGTWHYNHDGICYVNMSGALLAKHVGVDRNKDYSALNMPSGCECVVALDDLKDGDVKTAFEYAGFSFTKKQLREAEKSWSNDLVPVLDNANWLNAWKTYANRLKNIGL
jgi:hypothetical protein